MKSIISLTCRFKFLALSILLINSIAVAQKRPPYDISRVTVTNQYVVVDGKYKNESYAIKQELYDSLGRLHTSIDYNFSDHYPYNYYWHTFKGKLKSKTETFRNEKLQTIEEYTYNSDSLVTSMVLKKVSPDDTSLFLVLSYKYDSKKNLTEISAKSKEGKKAYVSKSTFDIRGKELTRKVKVKKNFSPQDSILKLISIPVYDSIGRLMSEQVSIYKTDKSVIRNSFKYTYDKNNNLIGFVEYDEKGKQIQHQEREYTYSRNRLSIIKYYDCNNELIKMIGMRYEIFRTNDHRFMEIDY